MHGCIFSWRCLHEGHSGGLGSFILDMLVSLILAGLEDDVVKQWCLQIHVDQHPCRYRSLPQPSHALCDGIQADKRSRGGCDLSEN